MRGEERMRKILKKLQIIALVFCLMATYFVIPGKVDAIEPRDMKIKVVFLETNGTDPSEVSDSLDAKYNVQVEGAELFSSLSKLTIGDMLVWCINPTHFTVNGDKYEEGDIDDLLDKDEQEVLEQIAYVGYGYNGDTSYEMLGATQVRMWQALGYKVSYIHDDIQEKIDQINENLKMFDKLPSFNNQTVRFKNDQVGEENAITLTDTNGVFSKFSHDITAPASYKINGNSLKIWREENDPMAGTYSFNLIPSGSIGVSHGYISTTDHQDVAYFEMSNPYKITVRYTTETADVVISKVDITTGEELPGSHLYIKDKENGDIIESWVSTDEPHVIDGDKFVDGREYILHEETAPDGYDLAQDITFIYHEEHMETIIMNDELTPAKVIISKQDITTGEEIPGAHLTITDKETGELIEEWTSTDEPHVIDGYKFEDGKEYILHEETAPEGYQVAQDITFTYNKDEMEPIVMVDEIIPENPETGIYFPTIVLGSGIFVALGGYLLINKKNKFKRI